MRELESGRNRCPRHPPPLHASDRSVFVDADVREAEGHEPVAPVLAGDMTQGRLQACASEEDEPREGSDGEGPAPDMTDLLIEVGHELVAAHVDEGKGGGVRTQLRGVVLARPARRVDDRVGEGGAHFPCHGAECEVVRRGVDAAAAVDTPIRTHGWLILQPPPHG